MEIMLAAAAAADDDGEDDDDYDDDDYAKKYDNGNLSHERPFTRPFSTYSLIPWRRSVRKGCNLRPTWSPSLILEI